METLEVEVSGHGDPFSFYSMWDARSEPALMPEALSSVESPATGPSDSHDLEADLFSHDRLKREAEGLFAGVALLNEMDPHEDIDEPNVEQGDDHDEMQSKITRVIEAFLRGLLPAPSGGELGGIRCPWGNISTATFCQSSFPCTSRAIQAHSRHCNHLQDFQAKEPFYIALEAFLECPESKTRIAVLQQRSRIIQEGLQSLPDINDFLCQLAYLPNGNLMCRRLECHKSDGFKPSSDDIQTHFRVFHCDNFEGALEYYTSDEILRRISSQCQRLETKSAIDLILGNAEAQTAIAQRISDSTYPRLKYPPATESSTTAHNLEVQKPSWEQLKVLRTLRAKFIVHHRQFLQRTASSQSYALQVLNKSCRRYADLLDTGLLTFKAIMNDESPSSLKEIFGFISLSYAMVGTMQARGKPVSFCLDKLEMDRWRSSLKASEDRDTFDKLVPLLWPELNKYRQENMHQQRWQRHFSWHKFEFSLKMILGEMEISPLRRTVERLLEESSSDESFCFTDWLNFSKTDASPFPANFELVGSPHDNSWIRSPEIQPPSDSNSRHGNLRGPSKMQHTDWDGDKTTLEQLQGLTQSVVFIQAISFLIFIGGIGILLFYLSASYQNCISTERGTLNGTNIASFSRFLEVIKFRILNPLCLDSSLSKFRPLFRTTVKVLEAGWLRSVRDVERYLICVTKLFADSRDSYLSIISKVLDFSLKASRDDCIDYDYLYPDSHQEVDDYSSDYVAKRIGEEAATFIENIMDFENVNSHFANERDWHPSIEVEEPHNDGSSSGPCPKRRRTSSTTPTSSPTSASQASTTSSNPTAPIQHDSRPRSPITSQLPISRKCDAPGCNKTYTGSDSANSLARHKREMHSNRPSFTCPVQRCGHVSRRLHNLRAHWETKHKGVAMPQWLEATQTRGGGGVRRKMGDSPIDRNAN